MEISNSTNKCVVYDFAKRILAGNTSLVRYFRLKILWNFVFIKLRYVSEFYDGKICLYECVFAHRNSDNIVKGNEKL